MKAPEDKRNANVFAMNLTKCFIESNIPLYVVNFIFGVLGVESERDRCYPFTTKVLNTVNHTTMAQFFDECVSELSK